MYHCDQCGWDGPEPAKHQEPIFGQETLLWTLRVCPECGQEVYETAIIRDPMLDPERRPG